MSPAAGSPSEHETPVALRPLKSCCRGRKAASFALHPNALNHDCNVTGEQGCSVAKEMAAPSAIRKEHISNAHRIPTLFQFRGYDIRRNNFETSTNPREKDRAHRTKPKCWSTRSNPQNRHVFRRVDAALSSASRDQRPFKKLVWQYHELLSQIGKRSVRRCDLRQHLCDGSISCGGFRSAPRHYNVRFRGQDSRCYRRVARRPFSRITIQNATMDLGGKRIRDEKQR